MKLIIRRNQADVKGLFGGHKGVRFSLYAQVQISDEEKALINRYKVGDYILAEYELRFGRDTVRFTWSVNDLIRGKQVETDDIGTLLKLEESVKGGCIALKNLLEVMRTFGGEEVIDVDKLAEMMMA
jgi:hypothetical protein